MQGATKGPDVESSHRRCGAGQFARLVMGVDRACRSTVDSPHAMTEFEWQKKVSRNEAAAVLRAIADGLAGDGRVELEQNGWQLKVPVGPKIAVELEVEVGESEAELEIELTWPTARRRRSSTGSGGGRRRRSTGRPAKGA